MQYTVSISNQNTDMQFVALIINMNCAITNIHVQEKVYFLWQINPWFKKKYIGANHPCVQLTVTHPSNCERGLQVFTGGGGLTLY